LRLTVMIPVQTATVDEPDDSLERDLLARVDPDADPTAAPGRAVRGELADMPQTMVDLDPLARAVLHGDPGGILRDPQRLQRRSRVDHLLGPVNLRRQIHTRQGPRPRLGIGKGLTHQREGQSKLVRHAF
jgi:hypothetical protein